MTSLLACKVRDCEFDEDTHQRGAWCRGIPGVEHAPGFTHQHWPKRSQGGRKVVALLCSYCHDRIDNGEWGNKMVMDKGHAWYVAYDANHDILIRHHYLDATNGSVSEPETLEGAGSAVARSSGSDSAPLKEEQDGIGWSNEGTGLDAGDADGTVEQPSSPDANRGNASAGGDALGRGRYGAGDGRELGSLEGEIPSELTRAECIAWAQRLRAERERNPWMTGDLLNAASKVDDPDNSWDANGNSLLDILRIQPETASNYQRVCAHVDMDIRVQFRSLSFGHFQSVYKLPDRDSWLKLAVDEGLSVSELRRRIKPPQPKPKRWTLNELWAALNNGCEPCPGCEPVRFFLRGLEKEQSMASDVGGPG